MVTPGNITETSGEGMSPNMPDFERLLKVSPLEDFIELYNKKINILKNLKNFIHTSASQKNLLAEKGFTVLNEKEAKPLSDALNKYNQLILERMETLEKEGSIESSLVGHLIEQLGIKDRDKEDADLIKEFQTIVDISKHLERLRQFFEMIKKYSLFEINVVSQESAVISTEELIKKMDEAITDELQVAREMRLTYVYLAKDIKKYSLEKQNMNLPLISVCIPAWEEEDFIRSAVLSIRRQTYPRWEIIICENGSFGTLERAMPYSYGGFRSEIAGLSAAKNAAAQKAHGEIIVFVDADTTMEPHMLEKIYEVFKANDNIADPQKKIVGGVCKGKTSTNKYLPQYQYNNFIRKLKSKAFDFYHEHHLNLLHYVFGSTVPFGLTFCTKKAFLETGGFETDRVTGEDGDFMARLKKQGKLVKIQSSFIRTSDRKFVKKGYLNIMAKWTFSFLKKDTGQESMEYFKK